VPCLAEGALAALDAGDVATHDRLAAEASRALRGRCDVVLLGQFSLARAAPQVAEATALPVVTTPGSAVRRLKALLGG
jgi:Asp/Glu/hydantoin racemase